MAVLASTSAAPGFAFRAAIGTAALLTAAACAGGPSLPRVLTVEPGRRTVVRLMQFTDNRVFTLQNSSSGSAAEVYSDQRSDTMTKVVTDEQLQALLDVFAEKGMFAHATRAVPAEARDALVIDQGDRRYVFHRGTTAPGTGQSFHEAMAYYLAVYNQATAYHTSDIHRGDLRAERSRAQTSAEAARLRLETLKGRGQ